MTDVEVIDGDPGTDLDVRQPTSLSVVPTQNADDLVARLDAIRDAMSRAMEKDVDYGVIPGTGSKPTLLKPGAEKLGALFQLDVQIENEKIWHDDGHLTVISRATVYHQPTGTRLGAGEGICTTREEKYAFRGGARLCPTCGKPAIIKGKAEYGGGFLCFKKKGGCGAKFTDEDTRITGQSEEKQPNPNIADTYNTVDKMASKRARIDAVLAVTGASALFTQDVPTSAGEPTERRNAAPAAQAASKAKTEAKPASPAENTLRMSDKRDWAAIGIARTALAEATGLTEEQYRNAMAQRYGGIRSAKQLSHEQAVDLVRSLEEARRLSTGEQVAS